MSVTLLGPLSCGHPPTATEGCGTGYAAMRGEGEGYWSDSFGTQSTLCYECAAAADRETIRVAQPGDRFYAYVSGDGRTITTWDGMRLMGSVHVGALHHWSREIHHISAWDDHGRQWSGTGAPGMYASLRQTKVGS